MDLDGRAIRGNVFNIDPWHYAPIWSECRYHSLEINKYLLPHRPEHKIEYGRVPPTLRRPVGGDDQVEASTVTDWKVSDLGIPTHGAIVLKSTRAPLME